MVAGLGRLDVGDCLLQLLAHLVKRVAEGGEGDGGEGRHHGDAVLHRRVVQDGLDLLHHIQTVLGGEEKRGRREGGGGEKGREGGREGEGRGRRGREGERRGGREGEGEEEEGERMMGD